ncbi:MAG: DUF92 domain-containing protein [Gemmatimonadetes bacterium]|nr:DUF92 domain-containing protein [Gemmatimonadota bacterium]
MAPARGHARDRRRRRGASRPLRPLPGAPGIRVVWGTGAWGLAALFTFFIGSTVISRICPDPAAERGEAKGGRRDAGQVLANGGAPALGALLGIGDHRLGLWVLTIGLAAAAADTWATALGATSRTPPRHLLTGRPVEAGTSGGVTWRGSLGGAAGAVSVGAVAGLGSGELRLFAACLGVGTLGMFVDSLLGATLQGRFHCPACDTSTERPRHRCGSIARPVGGFRWLTNDGVNAISTLLATGLGWWIVTSMS